MPGLTLSKRSSLPMDMNTLFNVSSMLSVGLNPEKEYLSAEEMLLLRVDWTSNSPSTSCMLSAVSKCSAASL